MMQYADQMTLTLVTGSDFTHAKSMFNFLASAKKFAPDIEVIVYDLGMTQPQLRKLARKSNYEVCKFDYSKYPTYFNIGIAAGEYAWKPVIIEEVAKQRGGIVWWMDAGNIITAPLVPYIEETRKSGFWRTNSGGTIGRWTHAAMLKYFDLPNDWHLDVMMYAGGCVAFDTQNKPAMKLLSDWAKYAQIKECIAPEGSNRTNHRQDQALLSVLAGIKNWPISRGSLEMPVVFQQDIDFLADPALYLRRRFKKFLRWSTAKFVHT